jgi:hypothetical protein
MKIAHCKACGYAFPMKLLRYNTEYSMDLLCQACYDRETKYISYFERK